MSISSSASSADRKQGARLRQRIEVEAVHWLLGVPGDLASTTPCSPIAIRFELAHRRETD